MCSVKKKLLSCLLVVVMVLSIIPATVFATGDATVVSNPGDLIAAIEAIPEGGSGEITIQGVWAQLDQGIYIENKDITFNLVSTTLVTAADEYGNGQPVILGYGANITINADDNSSMQAIGHTGNMGVVRIDNSSDWNEVTQNYEEEFNLTVNGGHYTCTEEIPEGYTPDYVFVATPGSNVVLADVVCNGMVEAIALPNLNLPVPGKLTIHSGKFTNDILEYASDGKYACEYNGSYYVRDKEMTDAFKKPLTNGKIVFNYAKPSAMGEATWLISEDFCIANPDFYFDPEGFKDDFTKLELGIYYGTAKEEFHVVDVVWDYDADVLKVAQGFIEKFPEDRPWFNVSDLELVNYWAYRNPDSEIDSLANYSGELKEILGNNNFLYTIEDRGGSDDTFYTERIGSAKLIFDDKVYFASGMIGARAEHAIYVPESTANTRDALLAAAQKRIDDYIGKNVVKITAATDTVTDYRNSEIAGYDSWLATAQRELAEAQATLAAEQAKGPSQWDSNLMIQCQFKIMECEGNIRDIPGYKQYFIDSFNEGGDLYFLQKATGDFFFDVEVIKTGETFKCIVIKDDTKLTVPTYATTDFNTNVSVATKSSSVPLDTIIEVEKLTSGTEYDKIKKAINVEDSVTYDIKLHSDSTDKYVTKLDDGSFEVRIPIPEGWDKENLEVYYVDDKEEVTTYDVTPKENYAVFLTNHFSAYTLATVKANTTPTKAPATGDMTGLLVWSMAMLTSGGVTVATITDKRKKR